jgi:predicted metalloendopeptidase
LLLLCCSLLAFRVFAQIAQPPNPAENTPAVATKTSQSELPKLEKFDPSMIDKTKDPCVDFYQYSCSKWMAAHPIPPDLPSMSTRHQLFLYNQTSLRMALEEGAADKAGHGQPAPDRRLVDKLHGPFGAQRRRQRVDPADAE